MSLTIDGKSLNQLGLALLPGFQHPAAPPIRDYTVSIPGRPGAYYFGSDIDPLEFNLPLIIKPQENRYELAAAIRKMVAAFIDPYGKPKEVKLVFDYEPDKYYMVRYSGSIPINRLFSIGQFELPLKAYDPWAYGPKNNEIRWGSNAITFESTLLLGTIGGATHKISNNFTRITETVNGYAVKPIFYIVGDGDNVSISINNNMFSIGTFRNSSWILDCERYVVVKDGKNALGSFGGSIEQLELVPGKNEIKIYGTNMNLNFEIRFRDRYM